MTVITHVQRKSRLAEMVDRPGGVSVGVALAQAKANLDGLKDQALAIISENIGALLAHPTPPAPSHWTTCARRPRVCAICWTPRRARAGSTGASPRSTPRR
ncbi:hypothetical protein ER13_17930 [Brevundimonas sp. EAKA]|uniref:hypothetical protein n=1 Tax=Brevundimonas sp. EAKA TaxID=1495854 RepID=UPI0004A95A3C|nr:hypothetical protein [Brevundimonas sp. EAKA]KDP93587.1 hypothetical protein ER13_17930 [Brevundimonas sp. EAKA]